MTNEQRQCDDTKRAFSTNAAGTTGHPQCKKMNLQVDSHASPKLNRKDFLDLNVKGVIIRFLKIK